MFVCYFALFIRSIWSSTKPQRRKQRYYIKHKQLHKPCTQAHASKHTQLTYFNNKHTRCKHTHLNYFMHTSTRDASTHNSITLTTSTRDASTHSSITSITSTRDANTHLNYFMHTRSPPMFLRPSPTVMCLTAPRVRTCPIISGT